MKAIGAIKLFMLSFLVLSQSIGWAQEYDDLYFNSSDRKKTKTESAVFAKNTDDTKMQNPTISTQTYGDETVNYSAKHVNPEYIARYKNAPKEESTTIGENDGDSYYVEDYDLTKEYPDEKQYKQVNNYGYPSAFHSSCDPWLANNYYGRSYYDPFMGGGYGSGLNMGIGYTFGYMPGLNMSLGYSSGGWGYNPYRTMYNPYRMYNPYAYDPWMNSMYDPWNGGGGYYPSYGYGSSWGSSYSRYGYSGYGGSAFYPLSGSGSADSGRNVKYGKRTARGSNTMPANGNNNRAKHYAQTERSNDNEHAKVASTDQRDYSAIQNEYYSRSRRSSTYSGTGTRSSSNRTIADNSSNRTSIESTGTTRSRATRQNSSYSRPSYKSRGQDKSSSYSRLSNYSNGRSTSSSNSGYQRSSGSSGSRISSSPRSYSSSGSLSSGGSRSGSYSSGSRSSGSSSSGRSSSSSSSGGRR